jgi:trimeric autotransporter adhesin
MSFTKQRIRVAGAFAALAMLALAVSCTGFFVNPTLTGVSVGPQGLSLNLNQTFQMTATGSYSDGSQKTLQSGVVWSTSDATTVSVGQTSGIATGVQTGSATITASSGGCSACSGTTTVTVVLTGVTSITVSPGSQSVSINGSPVYFSATAVPGGDITEAATWNVVDSTNTNQNTNFSISFVDGAGESFLPSSLAPLGTYTVNVTYPGTTAVGTAKLTVTP